jgi:predicted deacylase
VPNASSYALGDLVAQAGSQVRGNCLVSLGTSTVSLPVVITHGSAPGPVLAITAGIHGGEYVPMVAVRQFVRDLDPAVMRGTIVACLQSSPVAFQQRSAFVNPLDGKNLNRSFPGDPHGGPTARLAAWLWENLLAGADYYVDCHCGDLPEALEPFAGASPGPDGVLDERARAMADCFEVPRLIVDRLEGSTIRAAALAGIPAVLIEVGGEGRWSPEEADVQRTGLRRAAALVGILPADEGRPAEPGARPHLPLFEDAADVLSERSGLWYPEVRPGVSVAEGTRLGHLEDPLGDVVQEILAPTAGVLIYGLSSLAAAEGSLLASIARPLPTT